MLALTPSPGPFLDRHVFGTLRPRPVIGAAVLLAALALTGALLVAGPELLRPDWWGPVAALAALAVVSELAGVEYRRHGSRIMLDHVPILAAVAVVGPAGTGLVALSGPLVFGLYEGRPPRRTVFNVAQISVSAVTAAAVYVLLGGSVGRGAELSFAPDFLAYLAATVAFFAVNTVAYASIISATGQDGWWLSWKKVRDELNIAFDLGVAVLTFMVAHLYLDWGALALPLLGLPLVAAHVFTTVQTHLHEVLWDLVGMLVTLLEKQDPYTSGHSVRVARRCREVAEVMDLSASEVEVVEYAALLHDIGKLEMIFQGVLAQDGPLSEKQRELIEQHPIRGEELLSEVRALGDEVLGGVRHHHERWDGSGYPDGLSGEDIPTSARIIGVVDAIDAMRSERPYQEPLPPEVVAEELVENAGEQFDPEVVPRALQLGLHAREAGQVDGEDDGATPGSPTRRLRRAGSGS